MPQLERVEAVRAELVEAWVAFTHPPPFDKHSKIPFALSLSKGKRDFEMFNCVFRVRLEEIEPFPNRPKQHKGVAYSPAIDIRSTSMEPVRILPR